MLVPLQSVAVLPLTLLELGIYPRDLYLSQLSHANQCTQVPASALSMALFSSSLDQHKSLSIFLGLS